MITRFALISALALMLVPLAASAQSADPSKQLRERSLALVNEARAAEGLGRLKLDSELTEAARAHASDMLKRGYFAHTSPGGGTVMDRYLRAGGRKGLVVRENLSKCEGCRAPPDTEAVEQMHEGWMNSPGHRANILARGLTDFGFAVVHEKNGRRYGVQTFAGPGIPRGEVPDGVVEGMGEEAQSRLAARIINALRQDAAPVEPDARLRRHVAARLPDGDLSKAGLSTIRLLDNLPADFPWVSYQILSGKCGGCGTEPTNADVHFFLDSWSKSPRSRSILTKSSMQSIGFVIVADGRGSKIAVLLLAGG